MADRVTRFAFLGTLLGALLAAPEEVHAAPREPLCAAAAEHLHVGMPSPDYLRTIVPDRVTAVAAPSPAAFDAALGNASAAPRCTDARSTCLWLPQQRVGAIRTIDGTALCTTMTYLAEDETSSLHVIAGPASLGRHACWQDQIWFGSVRGVATVIEDNEGAGPQQRRLTIASRRQGRWTAACHLTVRHALTLVTDFASCREGLSCNAFKAAAEKLVARARAARTLPGDPWAEDKTLGQAAHPEMPVFGPAPLNGYTRFFAPRTQTVHLGGAVYRVTLGGGMIGWRVYAGWLVSFVREDGTPVAGVQVGHRPAAILGVRVH